VSAKSPIDRLTGIGWGLSPHASSFNLLTASKKLQSVLNFGQNVPGKLLEIILADLLNTLIEPFCWFDLTRKNLIWSIAIWFENFFAIQFEKQLNRVKSNTSHSLVPKEESHAKLASTYSPRLQRLLA